eukprot:gnl/Spiro4/4618_TR2308_c0_g1_i1.p3 gnl/Spiro4/4618_TR2308_c0_g1~~gnl/Spiro4/4618_TR2308_c0_g1_i1.p3  ORF type:complete len:163 (-),score=42.06 gnl/Spiro4/4618_TR2308_c0_g1_i1:60-548(-)
MARETTPHQLQLFGHEIQHFLAILKAFFVGQLHEVTWTDFEEKLYNVKSLPELSELHSWYLDMCLRRCLLNPKAASLLQVIHTVCHLILRFRAVLSNQSASTAELAAAMRAVRTASTHVYSVLELLAAHGWYENSSSALDDLLLRLDFNHFYTFSKTAIVRP